MALAQSNAAAPAMAPAIAPAGAAMGILTALSLSHMCNDMVQSVAQAMYPTFRDLYGLSFLQLGLVTLAFQGTASILQPLVGYLTDRRPTPLALPGAMAATFVGIVCFALTRGYPLLVASVAVIGIGSAIFHPEASRAARSASGGRHGLAQSLFQLGGNFGQAIGPLLVALIVTPLGQTSALLFAGLALIAMYLLARVSQWRVARMAAQAAQPKKPALANTLPRAVVLRSLSILMLLVFSKVSYLSGLGTYYAVYLKDNFGLSNQQAQLLLFVFLLANAAGTFIGGPIGDRYGRKFVIWASIVGVLPFTLALPYLGLVGTVICTICIGLVLASAFSAIVVYAQELSPGNVGMMAGLFFGLSFGLGGVAAAVLGWIADMTSLRLVYQITAFLPFIGLLTAFLPNVRTKPL